MKHFVFFVFTVFLGICFEVKAQSFHDFDDPRVLQEMQEDQKIYDRFSKNEVSFDTLGACTGLRDQAASLLYAVRKDPLTSVKDNSSAELHTLRQNFVESMLQQGPLPPQNLKVKSMREFWRTRQLELSYTDRSTHQTHYLRYKLDTPSGNYSSVRRDQGNNDIIQVEEVNAQGKALKTLCSHNTYRLNLAPQIEDYRKKAKDFLGKKNSAARLVGAVEKNKKGPPGAKPSAHAPAAPHQAGPVGGGMSRSSGKSVRAEPPHSPMPLESTRLSKVQKAREPTFSEDYHLHSAYDRGQRFFCTPDVLQAVRGALISGHVQDLQGALSRSTLPRNLFLDHQVKNILVEPESRSGHLRKIRVSLQQYSSFTGKRIDSVDHAAEFSLEETPQGSYLVKVADHVQDMNGEKIAQPLCQVELK